MPSKNSAALLGFLQEWAVTGFAVIPCVALTLAATLMNRCALWDRLGRYCESGS
jgi:hypothetical protein